MEANWFGRASQDLFKNTKISYFGHKEAELASIKIEMPTEEHHKIIYIPMMPLMDFDGG